MAAAVSAVVFPRSFWNSTPSWLMMNVITPEFPYSAGYAMKANPSREYLIFSGCCVKEPLPTSVLFQRDGKSKIICSDQHDLHSIGHLAPPVHDLISIHKFCYGGLVLHRVAREDNLLRLRPEN